MGVRYSIRDARRLGLGCRDADERERGEDAPTAELGGGERYRGRNGPSRTVAETAVGEGGEEKGAESRSKSADEISIMSYEFNFPPKLLELSALPMPFVTVPSCYPLDFRVGTRASSVTRSLFSYQSPLLYIAAFSTPLRTTVNLTAKHQLGDQLT